LLDHVPEHLQQATIILPKNHSLQLTSHNAR
jgi:hypothetical protein